MRLGLALLIAVAVVAVILAVVGVIVREKFVRPVEEHMRADYAKHWPMAAADLGAIGGLPNADGDACPRLGRDMPWLAEDGTTAAPGAAYLALPPSIVARLRSAGNDWPQLDPAITTGLDFSWIAALSSCGRWDFWNEWFAREPAPLSVRTPLPAFIILQHWSKLRLLKGLRDGDAASASADVLRLAALLFSTNELLGTAVGQALLFIDAAFRRAHPREAPQGPHPDLDASRRALMAVSFSAHVLLQPDEIDRILRDTSASPLRCLAVAQTTWNALLFRKRLARLRRAQLAVIERHLVANAPACHLEALVRAWHGDEAYQVADLADIVDDEAGRLYALAVRLPVIGAFAAEAFAAIAIPTGYNGYRAKTL